MLKLASDENFHGDILRGLFRRLHNLDVVRVQDAGLAAPGARRPRAGRRALPSPGQPP